MFRKKVEEQKPNEEEVMEESEATEKNEELSALYEATFKEVQEGQIMTGTVVSVSSKDVMVDVGYKSEGIIPIDEFLDPTEIKVGDEIDVFVDSTEDDHGMIILSKKKADKLQGWQKVISTYVEGDTVEARVIKKVKGGMKN